MAKICKPNSLFVAAAALALAASSSVLAQDISGVESVDFDSDIAAAIVTASDDTTGDNAVFDGVPVVNENRSADTFAQAANSAAAPDDEDRAADDIMADTDATDDVANEGDAAVTTDDGDDLVGAEGSANDDTVIVGATILAGWKDLELNNDAVNVLVDALSNPKFYDPTIKAPVCVLQINSGKFQTVAGTNYRYQVLGCPINFADELGACRNRECASSAFEVTVFQQTWTDTLQVSSIAQSA